MTDNWKAFTGQVVDGEFHLMEYLGGCDASAVFLTQRNGEKAAIKLLPASRDAKARLSRWGAAAKLSHPNLIRLFTSGRCDLNGKEFLYAVMEHAEEDLSQVLPQRPLTAAEVKDMLPAVLNALAYVHSRGLVHGHIKPTNILASGDRLKISSDSLSEIGEPSRARGAVYDAPESTSGLTPASDVWSLGVMLVHALTQRLPEWDGRSNPIPPQNLPVPFLEIARHCLYLDPQQRCTIEEILERLQPARPTPRKELTTPVANDSPRPRVAVALVAAVIIIGAIAGGARLLRHRPGPKPQPIAVKQASPAPQPEHTPAAPVLASAAPAAEEKPTAAVPVTPTQVSFDSAAPPKTVAPELIPGDVLQKVLPQVPERARDTIHGTVRVAVRVHVDPSGNVVKTNFDSFGPSKYFARLAQDASRRWKFYPPSRDGQDQNSEWVLRFEFTQRGTRVVPVHGAS